MHSSLQGYGKWESKRNDFFHIEMPTLCWRWSPLHVNFDISFCFSSTTPKAASASIQAANSLQAAAFVNEEHKRGVWGSQDLCPHCETFKGFRWVLGCARERERARESERENNIIPKATPPIEIYIRLKKTDCVLKNCSFGSGLERSEKITRWG